MRMVNEKDDFRIAVQTWLYGLADWGDLKSHEFEKLTKIFSENIVENTARHILTINKGKS